MSATQVSSSRMENAPLLVSASPHALKMPTSMASHAPVIADFTKVTSVSVPPALPEPIGTVLNVPPPKTAPMDIS